MSLFFISQGHPAIHAPAIHALVIGVGHYPWLMGGGQPTFASASGMGQISSAPKSARDFASWFLHEHSHPVLGDKTLDLLLSDEADDTFDTGTQTVSVERATMVNVQAAIDRWFTAGNANADSLMLFYFCGHGLGKGNQTILLAEDFGREAGANSLRCAIDFNGFLLGMDQCGARQQCYFVDACRVGSPFALNTLDYFGDPVIIPAAMLMNRTRSAPVFYSALPGQAAYGRTDKPSFFTDALLNAFKGAGSDDLNGAWRVETDSLHRGIRVHLKRAVANTPAAGQMFLADGLADSFTLHQLRSPPVVPVEVTCIPDIHNQDGALCVSNGLAPVLHPRVPLGNWHLDLPVGHYQFDVTLPPPCPLPKSITRLVRPPYQQVELLVP